MRIDRSKILSNVTDEFADKFVSYVQDIDPRFDAIIEAEFTLGNLILSVTKDWPNLGSVVIEFKNPLQTNHPRPKGIYFEMPNDPKGWAYQYSNFNYTNDNVIHMLISGANNA